MAGIQDINIPVKPRIIEDLEFANQKTDYSGLQNNLLRGMPLLDAMKEFGTDKALELSGLDESVQNDIKNNLPTDELAKNYVLPRLLDNLQIPNLLKESLIKGSVPDININRAFDLGDNSRLGLGATIGQENSARADFNTSLANNVNLRLGTEYGQDGLTNSGVGVVYQPDRDSFVDAGIYKDAQGEPEYKFSFGRKFAAGGAVQDIDIFSKG